MSSSALNAVDREGQEAQPRVLFVDDDQDFRRTVTAGLEAHGFTVVQASSAEEALNATAQADADFDIAVLDVMLPDSWGPEVGFEQSFLKPSIKFLYISGYTRHDTVLRASTANLPFLEKPFSIGELADTIRSLLAEGNGNGNGGKNESEGGEVREGPPD